LITIITIINNNNINNSNYNVPRSCSWLQVQTTRRKARQQRLLGRSTPLSTRRETVDRLHVSFLVACLAGLVLAKDVYSPVRPLVLFGFMQLHADLDVDGRGTNSTVDTHARVPCAFATTHYRHHHHHYHYYCYCYYYINHRARALVVAIGISKSEDDTSGYWLHELVSEHANL
jgi:hypothetical protein